MTTPDRSTAARRFDAHADRYGSDVRASNAFIRNVEEAIRHGLPTAAATRPRDTNTASQSAFTGQEQASNAGRRNYDLPSTPTRPALATSLHALQEWEGYVTDVREAEFVANLVDLTAGAAYEEEEATIPRSELSDAENEKMQPGSIFRWVIGYERSPFGTKKRVSHIVFRDLPAMTRSDLEDGETWARETVRAFGS